MKQKIFKFLAIVIILCSTAIGWYWMEYKAFTLGNVSNKNAVKLNISPGSNVGTIINQLISTGIISSKFYFKLYIKQQRKSKSIQAGEYLIQPNTSISNLLSQLVKGKVTQYQLTLPEGWTTKEILAHLKTTHLKQTLNNLDELEIIQRLNFKYKKLEGFIYPDTYYFPHQTTDLDFLKRSIKKMEKVLANEWKNRNKTLPLKTPYEALILASIVEKESGKNSERAKIAGVFIKRLQLAMRLQSDPTIIYGMGDSYKGNIRKKDINEKTVYNTYQIPALPPTPIASPGIHAIHAVLNPEIGNSLYFVADGSGGHYFSKNLKEHNNAVRKYILKK